jgi:hypothetical protein
MGEVMLPGGSNLRDSLLFPGNVRLPCASTTADCGAEPACVTHPEANLLIAREVTKILDAGKRVGCTEASSRLGKCQRNTRTSYDAR